MLGEPDGHDPRTPELDKNLVVVGRIEPHGDVAGPLLSQEVDATQKGPTSFSAKTSCTVPFGCCEVTIPSLQTLALFTYKA